MKRCVRVAEMCDIGPNTMPPSPQLLGWLVLLTTLALSADRDPLAVTPAEKKQQRSWVASFGLHGETL